MSSPPPFVPGGFPDSWADLRVAPLPGEAPAEYLARVRATPIVSATAGDIMPNVAQFLMPNVVQEEGPQGAGAVML